MCHLPHSPARKFLPLGHENAGQAKHTMGYLSIRESTLRNARWSSS
jgi:hypothetical protein